jgi:hypothetical protein
MIHHVVQEDCLALEDGPETLSRNFGNQLPTNDLRRPKRTKTAIYFNHGCLKHLILCFLLVRYRIMTDIKRLVILCFLLVRHRIMTDINRLVILCFLLVRYRIMTDINRLVILCFLLVRYRIVTDINRLVILCQLVLNCEALNWRLSGLPFGRNHIVWVFFFQVAQSRYDVCFNL